MVPVDVPAGHPYILGIVGSKDIPGNLYSAATELMGEKLLAHPFSKVVSGGAPGVDTLAKYLSLDWYIDFKEFLAENPRWEPDGYKKRNMLIATTCTHLLSIRWEGASTYGSGWTADYAERLGKTVWRYML